MMPVQEEVIPYLLGENNDVVALAQTGTGKTAAFGLPLIQQINVNNRIPQSLILCPTRELCLQIAGDLNDYSKYIDGLRVLPVYLRIVIYDAFQGGVLILGMNGEHHVFHVAGSFISASDGDFLCIVQVFFGNTCDFGTHGRGEQQCVTLLGHICENGINAVRIPQSLILCPTRVLFRSDRKSVV